MAKSLGNFTTIRALLARWPGETLRYFILTSHYRSPLSYTEARIIEAHAALSRLYLALRGLDAASGEAESAIGAENEYSRRFHVAMSDDFNTPEALAVLHDLAREINRRPRRTRTRTPWLSACVHSPHHWACCNPTPMTSSGRPGA